MIKKRIIRFLFVTILIIIGGIKLDLKSIAAVPPESTNLIIHKLQYSGDNKDSTLENDGEEKISIPEGFEPYNPKINGAVEFTLVDISDYVNNSKLSVDDIQKELILMDSNKYDNWISQNGVIVEKREISQNGIANFFNVDSTLKEDNHRYYVIFETLTPKAIKSPAQPILIDLPMTNKEGTEFLKEIHIYPKNQIGDMPDVNKSIVGEEGNIITGEPSYSIGDEVKYSVKIHVPKDINDYVIFEYQDQGDKGLTYTEQERPILEGATDSGDLLRLVEGKDYIYDSLENGFKINFIINNKVSPNVSKLSGSDINIRYSMTINEQAKVDEMINNNYDLTWQSSPKHDKQEKPGSTPVYTGGAKFVKKDGKTNEPLKDAEFIVKNKEGQYYHGIVNNKVIWGGKDGAERLVSNEKGEFEISGLSYGSYYLEEVKSPEGYALNTKDIPFTISNNTYTADIISVNNYRKSLLPQTGSKQLIASTIIGFFLILCSVIYFRRRKEN